MFISTKKKKKKLYKKKKNGNIYQSNDNLVQFFKNHI
jgi:hypothetical protein